MKFFRWPRIESKTRRHNMGPMFKSGRFGKKKPRVAVTIIELYLREKTGKGFKHKIHPCNLRTTAVSTYHMFGASVYDICSLSGMFWVIKGSELIKI